MAQQQMLMLRELRALTAVQILIRREGILGLWRHHDPSQIKVNMSLHWGSIKRGRVQEGGKGVDVCGD